MTALIEDVFCKTIFIKHEEKNPKLKHKLWKVIEK